MKTIYCLPYEKGIEFRINENGYIKNTLWGIEKPASFKSYSFRTKNEANILAVRKGTVVKIKDEFENNPEISHSFKSNLNYLMIEHPDGSIVEYKGFKKGSFTVKEGDIVYPQTVLGRNEKYNDDDKTYRLSIMIYYLKKNPFQLDTENGSVNRHNFIDPKFFFAENDYEIKFKKSIFTPEFPLELKIKEFTKKEIKNSAIKN